MAGTMDIATLGIAVDARQLREGDKALQSFEQTGRKVEAQNDAVTKSLTRIAAGVASAFAVGEILKHIDAITRLASRYNELGTVMGVLGKNAGYTRRELDGIESSLRKTGISATESRNSINKMISANIDLAESSKLARLAQDAAVIAGTNSSEAFQRLVYGIQSAQVEVLRTMGINVNFENGYKSLAKTLGKTTNDLTELEKTQSRVNTVLGFAPTIAEAYEASLTNAGKQLRSMERYVEDLKVALGQAFQAGFEQKVAALSGAVKFAAENVNVLLAAISGITVAVEVFIGLKVAQFLFNKAAALYESAAAAQAERAATLAALQTNVAKAEADNAQAIATRAAINAAREVAVAKLAEANANAASARVALAAAEATGVQSFALRAVKIATTEATAAETARVAALAELATLGQQTARVNAQIAASAQAAAVAEGELAVATRGAGISMGLLGGPIGWITTLLGLGATAWALWGDSSKTANKDAKESTDEAAQIIIKSLDAQIAKNKELLGLRQQGLTVDQAEKQQKYTKSLKDLNADLVAINNGTGAYAQMNETERFFERTKKLAAINDITNKAAEAQSTSTAVQAKTRAEAQAAWMKTYATTSENLAAELAKAKAELGVDVLPPELERRIREHFQEKVVGAEKAENAYQRLMKTIQEKTAVDKLDIETSGNVSEAQKIAIRVKSALEDTTLALTAAQKAALTVERDKMLQMAQSNELVKSREKMDADRVAATMAQLQAVQASIDKAQEELDTFGMVTSQVTAYTIAKEYARKASLELQGAEESEIAVVQGKIDMLKKLGALQQSKETKEQIRKAAEDAFNAWKKTAEQIEQALTEALMRGFESGKGFAQNMRDTLVNLFKTMILRPTISAIVQPMANGVTGMLQGGSGNLISNGASMLSGAGKFFAANYGQTAPVVADGWVSAEGGTGYAAEGSFMPSVGGALTAYSAAKKYGPVGGFLAGGASVAAGGAIAGAVSGTGIVAGATAALAAIPVWGWAAIAAAAVVGSLGGGERRYGGGYEVNSKTGEAYLGGGPDGGEIAGEQVRGAISTAYNALNNTLKALNSSATIGRFTAGLESSEQGKGGVFAGGTINGQQFGSTYDTTTYNLTQTKEEAVAALSKNLNAAVLEALQKAGDIPKAIADQLNAVDIKALTAEQSAAMLTAIGKQIENVTAFQAAVKTIPFAHFAELSFDAANAVLQLSGNVEKLAANTGYFAQNFLSEAERIKPVSELVTSTMAAVGASNVTTIEGFKSLVLAQDLTTEAGAKTFNTLMEIAPAFKTVTEYADKLAAAAKVLADKRTGLEIRIMELSGDSVGALAAQRALELAALDPSLRALQERVYALQDEASATKAAAEASKTITDAAREQADYLFTQVDAAYAGLERSVTAQRKTVQTAHEKAMKLIEDQIATVSGSVSKLKSLSDALRGTLDKMRAPGTEASYRQEAQAQIAAALAIARAGGPLPDAEKLQTALATVTQDASDQFATREDYLRDFYKTAIDIADLGGIADDTLSLEQRTLETLEQQKQIEQAGFDAEMLRLDGILSNAQAQIEVLKGIDNSILSLKDALSNLAGAMASARSNPIIGATPAINAAYQTSLYRAPEQAGLEFWQNKAATGTPVESIVNAIANSNEAKVQQLYATVLGRVGEAAGVDYWTKALNSGTSLDSIKSQFYSSAEYTSKTSAYQDALAAGQYRILDGGTGMPGFASGGEHAGGWRKVGERGWEMEYTGPSAIVNHNDAKDMLDNSRVVDAVADLKAEIAPALRKIIKTTQDTADSTESLVRNGVTTTAAT